MQFQTNLKRAPRWQRFVSGLALFSFWFLLAVPVAPLVWPSPELEEAATLMTSNAPIEEEQKEHTNKVLFTFEWNLTYPAEGIDGSFSHFSESAQSYVREIPSPPPRV